MLSPTADLILLIAFGYLLGSVPFGYLISRAKGIDIRKMGSGNIGGTNVSRAFGWRWGLTVSLLDILKAMAPIYLAKNFLSADWQIALAAFSPVLGHVFPVWLKFKGGKGVTTVFSALFMLLDWKIFLIWLLCWAVILVVSRIMSFTNLLMASFLPLVFWLSFSSLSYFIFGIALFALVWWTHRENLKRLKEGTEQKTSLKW